MERSDLPVAAKEGLESTASGDLIISPVRESIKITPSLPEWAAMIKFPAAE
jgi:hypothetical protein